MTFAGADMQTDFAIVDLGTWTYGKAIAPPIRPAPTLAMIKRMEDVLRELPQIDDNPVHHFAAGMYGRELLIPADSYVVGKTHRHEHFVLLLSGTVTINTERGMERITGPRIWVSPPGAKRALKTHTDCLFFTVHLNEGDARDLDAIEDYVIVPEPRIAQDAPQLSEFSDELQGVFA